MDYKVCSVRFDLHGIHKEDDDDGSVVDVVPSIKPVDKLINHIEISKVLHCDGLLLCVYKDKTKLVVWNPYLGQTRVIEPKDAFHRLDRYALGYDKYKKSYKILRFVDNNLRGNPVFAYQVYDLNSNSWSVLDVNPDWDVEFYRSGVSLKGNTYFFAKQKIGVDGEAEVDDFLLCFDYTDERFGPRLHVPFHSYLTEDTVTLSSLGEEKLAVLYQSLDTCEMQIWVTTKIEPKAVSWNKLFLAVDMSSPTGFQLQVAGSFFIDEEKNLAVVFDLDKFLRFKIAYLIGEGGYFRQVGLGEAVNMEEYPYGCPLVCSYVPSLVCINQSLLLSGKRKER
ncbi:PREDICTED: F-box/kelch-repeat protein At3g16740-like [Camelina sativa]|uniref:F-box/kelch-repeat protein At3g16740-like n=1 Tax=Camelina sativa TaxID=90675 RepID=A0ABM1RP04_CAMSA|nr:PREDICTED: F-box/kelch-repeat protein At3g16740-like [Camelina sativa]